MPLLHGLQRSQYVQLLRRNKMERQRKLSHTVGARLHRPLYSHIPYVHGIGIEATADKIGAGLSAVAIGGILAHAVATNIQKRNLIKNRMDDLDLNEEVHEEDEKDLDTEEKKIDKSLSESKSDITHKPQP